MAQAAETHITPRPEPEVLAANVRSMLTPFFNGRSLGPAPVSLEPVNNNPAPAARALVPA